MFNSVLLGIRENEKVQVLEKTSEIKPNGSEAIVWKSIKEILCKLICHLSNYYSCVFKCIWLF